MYEIGYVVSRDTFSLNSHFRQSESLLQNFYFRNPSSNVGPRKGGKENDSKASSTILGSIFGTEDSETSSSYDSV